MLANCLLVWTVDGCIMYCRAVSFYSCHFCYILFFSRPRSEGWPHHGRTFSIYLCPLSFWLTLSWGVLSTSWCCLSRQCVVFLICMHYLFFQAISVIVISSSGPEFLIWSSGIPGVQPFGLPVELIVILYWLLLFCICQLVNMRTSVHSDPGGARGDGPRHMPPHYQHSSDNQPGIVRVSTHPVFLIHMLKLRIMFCTSSFSWCYWWICGTKAPL